MTFSQFTVAIRSSVLPDGAARNLTAQHRNWITDALIRLQKLIPCMQYGHVDCIVQGDTGFSCGASYVQAPPGTVLSLEVGLGESMCEVVRAVPVNHLEFRTLLDNQQTWSGRWGCPTIDPEPYEYGAGYILCDTPDRITTSDNDRRRRANDRSFALFEGKVWTWPVLQSDEIARIRWNGIKRRWRDSDDFPWLDEEGEPNREVHEAVEYFLASKIYQFNDCDLQKATAAEARFREKLAEMVVDCREMNNLPWARDLTPAQNTYNQRMYIPSSSVPGGSTTCPPLLGLEGYAALKAVSDAQNNQLFFLLFGDNEGDFGGGYFRYDSTSLDAESLPNVVIPNSVDPSEPGRFIRQQ